MKLRIALVAITLMLGCSLVQAQSSLDVETRYGKSVDIYSVSETLWMSPSYDNQGQVCMMRVFPKAVSKNTNYLGSDLNPDETLMFINELFPVHTRGRRQNGFGMSNLGGGIILTEFNYEHVQFTFISSFRLTKLPDKSIIHQDFPVNEGAYEEYRRLQDAKSDDQLIREHTGKPKILEVVWPNRKCVKP